MPGLSRSGQNKSAIGNKINRFDVEKIFKQMCRSVSGVLSKWINWNKKTGSQ